MPIEVKLKTLNKIIFFLKEAVSTELISGLLSIL